MSEQKEFKVNDRRASSGTADDGKPKQGAGFTMKEDPKESVAAPPPQQIDFSTLVFSLGTGALIHLGLTPDPTTNQMGKNVELARQDIDILTMLKEKTKGNLTPDESKLLEGLLTELRLRYVEATR